MIKVNIAVLILSVLILSVAQFYLTRWKPAAGLPLILLSVAAAVFVDTALSFALLCFVFAALAGLLFHGTVEQGKHQQ